MKGILIMNNVKNKKLAKVDEVIEIIDNMDIKDRLRLGVCMSESTQL